MMFADSIEVNRTGKVIHLKLNPHLSATYSFTTEEDCREAEMMIQQIELALSHGN